MSFKKQTPVKYEAFLAVLSATGLVARACEAIDVNRSTVFRWRQEDPAFQARWEEALKVATSTLEDEAIRRGRDGVDKPIYQRGEQVGFVREYSDSLLQFMLRASDPKKYRDNSKVELSGDDGGPIQLDTASKAEKIRAILAAAQQRKNDENDCSDLC